MLQILKFISKYANNKLPPMMVGAKAIIEQLAAEEKKISSLNKNYSKRYSSMIREKEEMASIFTKYVNFDINKEVYLFIK